MTYSVDKVFPPYSEESMGKVASRNTICETLRQIYSDINEGKLEDAKYKIRVAVTMAKRMSTKLNSYNRGYAKSFSPKKNEEENKNGC